MGYQVGLQVRFPVGVPGICRGLLLVAMFFGACGACKTQDKRLRECEVALRDPSVQAMLDVIARSEGAETWASARWGGIRSYLVRYPYGTFVGFQEHPHEKICSYILGKKVCSTAAGRYQILAATWDWIRKVLKLKDFSPRNQDIVAVFLIIEKGALEDVKRGRFETAVNKLNRVWPSFPGSPYGQPTKKMASLKKIFEERRLFYSNGGRR
ncbi:TPA: hypothetical protein DDZ86_03870 [Candidatus Dependentiae bacterium]|nr:MAG: Lysozyme [candidate division TM6 bacterium GW2011_GWF2_43_87]HBL98754.1 hypothetical protein [Candidatus Dependentiae bacterium]